MSRRLPTIGLAIAAAIFAIDQFSKYYVTGPMGIDFLGASREIVPPVFNVTFVLNCGVSLGLLRADSALTRWALVVLTGAIAGGVVYWMTREKNAVERAALGSVLGGALGNISDRAVPPGVLHRALDTALTYPGCVVDFADLHFRTPWGMWQPFLVFNVADAAITIGVLVLFARAFLVREPNIVQGTEQGPVEKSHA